MTTKSLPDGIMVNIISFAATPKDAVRLSAASKRLLGLEETVCYRCLTVRATNTSALSWMRARGERIIGGRIECDGAPLAALRNAYETARATLLAPSPTPVRLVMSSKLFAAILALLKRDGVNMVSLLKEHLQNSVSGAEHVADSAEREMGNIGYDCDYDPRSRASVAWVIDDVIHTGARGQLDVVMYLWQSRNEPCKFSLEVRRGSSGAVLKRTDPARADEKTVDWWLVAADLYTSVQQFETKRVEAVDNIRAGDSD